ncbi:MAG: peptide chain release factor 2 [Patescibacteria group bacterium]|nr:peptide chain release factor 2 [Patescibacteria group bacterium]
MKEFEEGFLTLKKNTEEAIKILNLNKEKEALKGLEEETLSPDFWKNETEARQKMQNIALLKKHIETWENFLKEINDSLEIARLTSEKEHEIINELKERLENYRKKYEELETELLLSESYDKNNAILSIYSGAGGTEAQDWAEMLLRMYLRYSEKEGFIAKIVSISPGDQAGIKSVSVQVSGLFAYGFLKYERGVHRLVRLSPFDADHARHTSFALVEIFPEIEETEIKIDEKDLKIDTFRASGHGGQGVNTTDSAVRITHLPTGITVTCQNERSQMQNKAFAMKMLVSRLKVYQEEKRTEEEQEIRGKAVSAEWGNQIRSYVLHPYNMVKDLRTGYETSNTSQVLDGEIREIIDSELKFFAKEKRI